MPDDRYLLIQEDGHNRSKREIAAGDSLEEIAEKLKLQIGPGLFEERDRDGR